MTIRSSFVSGIVEGEIRIIYFLRLISEIKEETSNLICGITKAMIQFYCDYKRIVFIIF
jgi:hypothetical protein